MTEGELYKKILEKTYQTLNGEVQYGTKPTKQTLPFATIEYEDLMKVLDEAKQDFPMTSPELEAAYPHFQWIDELNSRRLKWYHKWFGDGEVTP